MDEKTTSLGHITVEDLAKYLSAVYGEKFDPEEIRADIKAGAPTNPDGTMHLIEYTAWLARERRRARERPRTPPTA